MFGIISEKKSKIEFVSVNEILDIHDRILNETGGESGLLNMSNMEFTVDFVENQSYSIEIIDIFLLSAIIVRDIIQGHPFVDGNKRTGMEVLDVFLRKNGHQLDVEFQVGVAFALNVATNEMTISEIRDLIHTYSRKNINNGMIIKEEKVTYMTEVKKKLKRENPYNISEESMAMIDASIKKNKKLLEELAKY